MLLERVDDRRRSVGPNQVLGVFSTMRPDEWDKWVVYAPPPAALFVRQVRGFQYPIVDILYYPYN